MKLSNIFESLLNEVEYASWNKTAEGYSDANSSGHTNERVWVHTNFTNKNNRHNGAIGVYTPNSEGFKSGKPQWYTNEIRINGPLVFEQPAKGAERIKKAQLKQLIAGVSGVLIPSGPLSSEGKGDTGDMKMVMYNAKEGLGYFHLVKDEVQPPRKIVGGDEAYLWCSESGDYGLYVREPLFEDDTNEI